jgi:putative tryptophan/tyrosine transport system substrate-binding protein
MKRREFIAGLGGAAASASLWPLVVRAQQPAKMKRIAIVHPNIDVGDLSITSEHLGYQTLFEELRRRGYSEGRNLVVERYSAAGQAGRYADLARDVVRTNPDLILAIANPLVLSFKEATTKIPLVAVAGNMVASGIVPSLAQPNGNITGISTDVGGNDIWGKRLALLLEATPKSSNARFLTLRSSWERVQGEAVRKEARQLGISLEGALLDGAIDEAQIRRVFTAMEQDRVDALMVIDDAGLFPHRQLIVELASKGRIPAIYAHRIFVEPGGLMTYSFDLAEMYRHAAEQIDRILRGEKPGDIPVFQAARYELIVNLKTAKALGLELPTALVARADEVIE